MRTSWSAFWTACALVAWPHAAVADANIVVDGNFGDWPEDAWGYEDSGGDNPPPYADVQSIQMTNNNTSDSNGYLFIAVDFFNDFRYNIGAHDVDVWLYLDIDGDGQFGGPLDRAIELTEQEIRDGDGNLVSTAVTRVAAGDQLEAAIPYSALGLTHGSDSFGVAVAVVGHPNNVEYSPEPGTGDNGFIAYDGTQGDGIEPLAVSLLAARAAPVEGGVELTWVTASERRNAGFHVLRARPGGRPVRLTAAPVPGLVDAPVGRLYRFLDPAGRAGDAYLLEDLEVGGRVRRHAPIAVDGARPPLASPRGGQPWAPPAKARSGSRRLRAGEAGQLGVSEQGLHRLGPAELAALGLTARTAALARASGPVPVVQDGAGGLLFVGVPLRDRHAELEVIRVRPGRPAPMATRAVDGGCAGALDSLPEEVWLERQREYFVAAPGEDPFFWASAFPAFPARLEFELPGLRKGPAELGLRVVGVGAGPHRVELGLGACALGEVSWTGAGLVELRLPAPEGCLAEHGDALEVALPAGADWDAVFVDGLGVQHARALRAKGGVLEFGSPPGACLQVGGLAPDARLFEVTEPARPVELTGFAAISEPDGSRALRFADPGDPRGAPRRYLAVSPAAARAPAPMAPAGACALADPALGADHLIVTHPDLLPSARRLVALHEARGLRARAVTTREAYDCFAFGRPGPEGLRALFEVALTTWASPPRYALLLGGATVDPQGFLGSPPDLVPAPFARLGAYGYEAPSDGWYVAGPDGVTPRLALGRLAVASPAEADAWVDKFARALASGAAPTGRWALVADDREPGAAAPTGLYPALALELWRECGPADGEMVKVFKAEEGDPRGALEAAMADKAGLDAVLYFGHAFLSGWSSGPALADLELAARLENERPFVLLSFTCFDGAFTGPWAESLAWALVRNPAGGALAATAASTLSDPVALRELALALACGLTRGREATLGQALRAALGALAAGTPEERDMARAYHLLGDPATPFPAR